ncbi:MAG: hypothetical protein EPO06_05335 [Burkholderiaceae bacterium]|nr:MAG: hypothetical protein EPO06_05335 [Burkholderiaceae bacterium]
MNAATDDDDFPILSDVLDTPAPAKRATAAAPTPAPLATPPAPTLTAAELEQFEHTVREQIMAGLSNRVDVMLQLRIEEIVQELVGQTIHTLSEELKQSVKDSLADIVQRAVSEEMGRVRTRK